MADQDDAADKAGRSEPGHGVRIVLGNAAVSAIVAAITTVLAGQTASPKIDEAGIVQRATEAAVERATASAMRQAEARFIDRELVREQLRSIADKVDAIDRRTADLPRMAAELSLVQRTLGK